MVSPAPHPSPPNHIPPFSPWCSYKFNSRTISQPKSIHRFFYGNINIILATFCLIYQYFLKKGKWSGGGGGTRVCFVVVVGFWDQDKINMCFVICEEILKLAKIKFSENPPRKKRSKEIKKHTQKC